MAQRNNLKLKTRAQKQADYAYVAASKLRVVSWWWKWLECWKWGLKF